MTTGADQDPEPGAHLASEDVNFLDLDLNLLIALDALLAERSVTGAAELLHRSQPALSASLKRLRRQFGDDLLVRVGNRHELTPIAEQLKTQVATVLADVERLFATRARFDPARSARRFVVGTADYGQAMIGPRLAQAIAEESSTISVHCQGFSNETLDNPANTLRAMDGMIVPRGFFDGYPVIDMYSDRWVLLVDANNSRVGDSVTLEELGKLDWVLPYHRPQRSGVPAVRQLQLLGVEVEVVVGVDGFLSLPLFVAGTDRISMIQKALADRVAHPPEFRTIECPFDAVPLNESFWWHPTLEHDPGHIWFRSVVERVSRDLAAAHNPPDL
jgi:DNA-binding transcriptional LysR family regulator